MSIFDRLGTMAGIKAVQAGADIQLHRHTRFDPSTIPADIQALMNEEIRMRFLNGEITDFDAALMKLSWMYRDAERLEFVPAQRILYEAITQLREAPGAIFSHGASIECMAMTGMGPDFQDQAHEELPLADEPSLAGVGSSPPDYEQLLTRYEGGELDVDEYIGEIKQLLVSEIGVLIEQRLRAAFGAFI